jgi:hypothetical protein
MTLLSIHDILESGEARTRYDIVAKIVGKISKGYISSIAKWGVLTDNSAAIRFVVWPNCEELDIEENNCYFFENVEYRINNCTPNLKIDRNSNVNQLSSDIEIDELDPIEFDPSLPCHIVRVRGICLGINPSIPIIAKQKGWIGNREGFKIPFVLFHSGEQTPLDDGKIYDFQYASIEEFHNKRELYVDCSIVTEIQEDEYPIDPYMEFTDLDPDVVNISSKDIYPHFFRTAQTVLGLNRSQIEDRIQGPLIEMKELYAGMEIIDYSNPDNQLAYIFGYFPYYIEPINDVLKSIERDQYQNIFYNRFNVNFYGCGPCPELLGLLRFLSEEHLGIDQINVTFFDGESWDPWRNCVIENISNEYWDGSMNITEKNDCNLLELPRSDNSSVNSADIHIIQNVCSDLVKRFDSARVLHWLRSIYAASKENSMIFIIDIPYSYIYTTIFEPLSRSINSASNTDIIILPRSSMSSSLDYIPPRIHLPSKRQYSGFRHMEIIKTGSYQNAT